MPKYLYRHIPAGFALLAATATSAGPASYALDGGTGLIDMPSAQFLPDGESFVFYGLGHKPQQADGG